MRTLKTPPAWKTPEAAGWIAGEIAQTVTPPLVVVVAVVRLVEATEGCWLRRLCVEWLAWLNLRIEINHTDF